MPKTGITQGSDLLLYADVSTSPDLPNYVAVAHATSHTIDYSAKTKDRLTKDVGLWGEKAITGFGCSIKCEALVSYDAAFGYSKILALFKKGKSVKLKYAYKTLETGDTFEEGLFIITSLSQASPAGDDTTMSISFENTGEILTTASK